MCKGSPSKGVSLDVVCSGSYRWLKADKLFVVAALTEHLPHVYRMLDSCKAKAELPAARIKLVSLTDANTADLRRPQVASDLLQEGATQGHVHL